MIFPSSIALRAAAVVSLSCLSACSTEVPAFRTLSAKTVCSAPCVGYEIYLNGDSYVYGEIGHKKRFAGKATGLRALGQSLLQAASRAASTVTPRVFANELSPVYPIQIVASLEGGSRTFTLDPQDEKAGAAFEAFGALVRKVVENVSPQAAAIRHRLEEYDEISAVSVEQSPFLRCAGATFTFRRSGAGSAVVDGRAHALPAPIFAKVLAILRQEDAAMLYEDYPFRVRDVASAVLTLQYKTFRYTVTGPDRTNWPPSLTNIVARIDEAAIEGSGDALKPCLAGWPGKNLVMLTPETKAALI